MTTSPKGWTDDMNIPLPEGVTAAKIAEFVLSSAAAGESYDARIEKLRSLGLTPDDPEARSSLLHEHHRESPRGHFDGGFLLDHHEHIPSPTTGMHSVRIIDLGPVAKLIAK